MRQGSKDWIYLVVPVLLLLGSLRGAVNGQPLAIVGVCVAVVTGVWGVVRLVRAGERPRNHPPSAGGRR